MKKVLTTALAGLLCLSMLPMAMFASAAESKVAPKITLDGNLDDWKDVHTISIVGSGANEGKKATFYGVLGDDGMYLACDAYHQQYKTTEDAWWKNSALEIFFAKPGQEWDWYGADNRKNLNHVWSSAMGKELGKLVDANVNGDIGEYQAKIITEEVSDAGANVKYHTVTELFLPNTLEAVKNSIIDGAIRVGVCWKTPGDKCNNGEAETGKDAEDWVPAKSWRENGDMPFVTADGMYLKVQYEALQSAAQSTGKLTADKTSGNWNKSDDGKTYTLNECLTGNNFATYALGNASGKKVTVSAKVALGERKDDNNGGDSAILFAATDKNSDGLIEEGGGDFYYLVDLSKGDGGYFVAVERNVGGNWPGWAVEAKLKDILGKEPAVGDEVTISATWDPAKGSITVTLDGKEALTYTDEFPLQGTGYALASKNKAGTFKEVTVTDEANVKPDPTTPGGNPGGDDKPPKTGSTSVAVAAVAMIALAGAMIATRKREQD